MIKAILSLCCVALFAVAATPTYASTIPVTGTTGTLDLYTTPVTLSGQGLGAVTTILAIQDNSTSEATVSGCVGSSGGSPIYGSSACNAHATGGVWDGPDTATGGSEATPPPNSVKNKLVDLTTFGITSTSNIGVIFNGGDPNKAGAVSLDDLSFKFYNSTGTLLLDLSDDFAADPLVPLSGQGNSGYIISIDPAYYSAIASLSGVYFSLDATVDSNSGSPEDFQLVNLGNTVVTPTPEPSSLMLLGTGIVGVAGLMRRRLLA